MFSIIGFVSEVSWDPSQILADPAKKFETDPATNFETDPFFYFVTDPAMKFVTDQSKTFWNWMWHTNKPCKWLFRLKCYPRRRPQVWVQSELALDANFCFTWKLMFCLWIKVSKSSIKRSVWDQSQVASVTKFCILKAHALWLFHGAWERYCRNQNAETFRV